MSRYIWGNTEGSIWVDKPYTEPPAFTMSVSDVSIFTLGNLEPQEESFIIDWGDDVKETFSTSIVGLNKTHAYSDETEHIIKIIGAKVLASDGDYYIFANWLNAVINVKSWGEGFFTNSLKRTFINCTNLISLPTSWTGLENVTIMDSTFYNCPSLVSLPTSWTGLENVTIMTNVFHGCTNLVSLPDSWVGLESLQNLGYAFFECSNLVSMPDSWLGLESLTNLDYAFYECTSLANIGTTGYSNLSNISRCNVAFGTYNSLITSDILGLYNQLVTTATVFSDCFRGLTLAENYDLIPDIWK